MDNRREGISNTLSTELMTTTMAALISTTESKIVYVWAPYSVFLLVIFIVLAVSFVRHTRRVLRRRRVMLDYMEANVLCKRPRIVRMFTSSISRAVPLNMQDASPRDDYPTSHSGMLVQGSLLYDSRRPSAGSFGGGITMPAGFRDSHRYLHVPVLGPRTGRRSSCGLEDSGQSAWFQNGALLGQSNLAFSFDEDFGRSHFRRVIPEALQGPAQLSESESGSVRRERLSHMDAVDMESRDVNCCSTQTSPLHFTQPSVELHRTSVRREPPNKLKLSGPSPDSNQRLRAHGSFPSNAVPACIYCGHDLLDLADGELSSAGLPVAASSNRTSQPRKTAAHDKKYHRVHTKSGSRSDSFTVSNTSRTESEILSQDSGLRPGTDSHVSGNGHTSSESTATTVMTLDSVPSLGAAAAERTSGEQRGRGHRVPHIEQMASALEVYTIPTGETTLQNSLRQDWSIAPHSEPVDRRGTTSLQAGRPQSAFLPLLRTGNSTTTQPQRHLPPLPRPRSSLLIPPSTTPTTTTSTSVEKNIFWLATSGDLQQTLV